MIQFFCSWWNPLEAFVDLIAVLLLRLHRNLLMGDRWCVQVRIYWFLRALKLNPESWGHTLQVSVWVTSLPRDFPLVWVVLDAWKVACVRALNVIFLILEFWFTPMNLRRHWWSQFIHIHLIRLVNLFRPCLLNLLVIQNLLHHVKLQYLLGIHKLWQLIVRQGINLYLWREIHHLLVDIINGPWWVGAFLWVALFDDLIESDWLEFSVMQRSICVHLRTSHAKNSHLLEHIRSILKHFVVAFRELFEISNTQSWLTRDSEHILFASSFKDLWFFSLMNELWFHDLWKVNVPFVLIL